MYKEFMEIVKYQQGSLNNRQNSDLGKVFCLRNNIERNKRESREVLHKNY